MFFYLHNAKLQIFVVTLPMNVDFVNHNTYFTIMYKVALFDLDGVVLNTEEQYSCFWARIGRKYLPYDHGFANKIKGSTLAQIFNKYFKGESLLQNDVKKELHNFERSMSYTYVPGFTAFVTNLRTIGVKIAIVTSSNLDKMHNVYAARPEIRGLFDTILTSEDFEYSKPNPDGYIKGAKYFGVQPNMCVGFEDSINGLKAVKAANMFCVGLATTNSTDVVGHYADIVMNDYIQSKSEKDKEIYNKVMSLFV